MPKLLRIIVLVFAAFNGFSQTNPGKCVSYDINGNEVVFNCENNAKVMLKLCSRSVVKVWYEPSGEFNRTNESFAVVNESLENIERIHVESQEQAFEIFTDFLRIRVNKNPFTLQIFDKYQKLLLGDYKDRGHLSDTSRVSSYKILRTDEQFYGLGEKTGNLNRRGKSFKMWNSDKPCYSVSEDPLYKSIPFFMSSYRYGIFFDNTYKSEFKFGSESNDYYSFEAPGGELLYYFIQGNDYKQIIGSYTKLTGNPIMPPKWGFGFSQCRGLLTREDLTRDIAKGYRDRNIPCDIIYQDIGWTQWLQDFEWRKGNYENPKQMLADLSAQGFKVVVSQDPVISQANQKQWREADSLGFLAMDVRTGKSYDMPWPWGGNCGVVDFTNPKVANWWGALQQKPVTDGIRGFWTDMGEPAWSNEESSERLYMRHYAGSHAEIHNVYGFTWDKIVTEQFEKRNPNTRIFQMTRAGYAGLQRYTFGWSGDSGNGNEVLDGWGQLANQLQVGQSAGMGLIPFWSCDISGYCGDIKDHQALSELYIRWLQFGIFNPISRAHHEGNHAVEPWLFGEEVEQLSRKTIEFKYQLFPYIYTYAREAYDTGLPLMRAMLLEYPNDPEAAAAESQFMLGKELLVAPVVQKGADVKRIYLPEGEWIDYNDQKVSYKGLKWIEYPVTLGTIPLFVKRGSVIPMMPAMQFIHEKKNYPIILKVFPSSSRQSASFELYEDDGESNDYRKNIFSKSAIKCFSEKEKILVTVANRQSNGYNPESRNMIIDLVTSEKPASIFVGGAKIKAIKPEKLRQDIYNDLSITSWSYDGESQTLQIRLPDSGKETLIEIIK